MDFKIWNIFWSLVFGVVAIIIMVGNTVSISVLLKKRLRKRSRYLLVSLAIADLLVGLFAIPMYIMINISGQKLVSTLVYNCADMLTGLSSIFTLAVISLERLHAIARPLQHRQLTSRSYIVAITTPWILSLIASSSRVLLHFFVITNRHFLAIVIISLSTPLLISCISYCIIWRKQSTRMRNEVQVRKETKLAWTLLLITAIFVLTWLPFQVIVIVYHLCISCRVFPIIVFFVIKLLQYSNSLINFFIYCFRMPDYRNAVSRIFCNCKFNHNRHREGVLYPQTDNKTGILLISFTSSLNLYTGPSSQPVQDIQ